MIMSDQDITLSEFVEQRVELNDIKDGIKVIHGKDVFMLKWN